MCVIGVASVCLVSALGCLAGVLYSKSNVPLHLWQELEHERRLARKKVYRDLVKVQELEEHMPTLSADIERMISIKRDISQTGVPHCSNTKVTAILPKDYLERMGVPDANYWVSPRGISLEAVSKQLEVESMAELKAMGLPPYRTPPETACVSYIRREVPQQIDVAYSIPGQPQELPDDLNVADAYLRYFCYHPEAVTVDPQTKHVVVQRVYSLLDSEVVLVCKTLQNSYVVVRPYEGGNAYCEGLILEMYKNPPEWLRIGETVLYLDPDDRKVIERYQRPFHDDL